MKSRVPAFMADLGVAYYGRNWYYKFYLLVAKVSVICQYFEVPWFVMTFLKVASGSCE